MIPFAEFMLKWFLVALFLSATIQSIRLVKHPKNAPAAQGFAILVAFLAAVTTAIAVLL